MKKKQRTGRSDTNRATNPGPKHLPTTELRIIGGTFRGHKLKYAGDRRVRPMKDRVREAIFNLLTTEVRDKYVYDLFAGTGALGLEALSRGAQGAVFVERHLPTARVILQNVRQLDVERRSEVVMADTFYWVEHQLQPSDRPWLVFCSPPYSYYVDRRPEMLSLVATVLDLAGPQSIVCLEADQRFEFADLPQSVAWQVRPYAPAVVGIWRKLDSVS